MSSRLAIQTCAVDPRRAVEAAPAVASAEAASISRAFSSSNNLSISRPARFNAAAVVKLAMLSEGQANGQC
jgi:hypothetical protein